MRIKKRWTLTAFVSRPQDLELFKLIYLTSYLGIQLYGKSESTDVCRLLGYEREAERPPYKRSMNCTVSIGVVGRLLCFYIRATKIMRECCTNSMDMGILLVSAY